MGKGEENMAEQYLLQMKSIVKEFPGVKALKNVDFNLYSGEVHTLMGENGAGKSTLIKILTGVYQKDSGEIIFDGNAVSFATTLEAQKKGISTVYQELNMIPYLTVGENIFLGRYPKKKIGIDWNALHENAQRELDDMGLEIDSRRSLDSYGTASWQMVSIVRAISLSCKVVVLDEPTSSLDTNEVKTLFTIVDKLKKKGIGIIFISHRLDEVYAISDRITVLKDGAYEGTYYPGELTQFQLVQKMVGKNIEQSQRNMREFDGTSREYVVEMEQIWNRPKLNGVSINVKRGEIVGLAGLLGAGRTELARVLFGYDIPQAGSISVNKKKVALRSPTDALAQGLAFVTENRREEGVIPNMSIRENISISSMKSISRYGFICRKEQAELAERYIERLHIKTPSMEQKLKNLSGGNQQKVLLARWLATNPCLVILDEPTRGIDVGAKQEVEELIKEIAEQGIGVLFISSELQELVRNCDRIFVLRDGKNQGELQKQDISEELIMQCIVKENTASG